MEVGCAGKPRRHIIPILHSCRQLPHADICSIASIITIVISACDVARKIKDLIQSVKKHDEKMKDLEDKLDEIKMVLDGANEAYGQNESQSYSTLEQRIRKTIEKVVVRCNDDLKQFETKLEGFVARGNWAAVAWKEKTITPALDDIGKKLSDRQQRLHMLVQLLQGSVTIIC